MSFCRVVLLVVIVLAEKVGSRTMGIFSVNLILYVLFFRRIGGRP